MKKAAALILAFSMLFMAACRDRDDTADARRDTARDAANAVRSYNKTKLGFGQGYVYICSDRLTQL